MHKLPIKTHQHSQMIELTSDLHALVRASGVTTGSLTVYVPHTTAGVTINENADPDVVHDFLKQLDAMVPWNQPFYKHGEGNSAAHVKASMMGFSATILIDQSKLVLDTWQGVWFCEFDGPRSRHVFVQIQGE